jgi:hypothetical protein
MPFDDQTQNASLYQITINGNLDPGWSTWLNWMDVSFQDESRTTTLTGKVADQAELRGILNKIWDLNKAIISVYRLQDRI